MNIFVLDTDPLHCAWAHCDVHVNKMILESCQLLSNAHENGPYKQTHMNHPCSVWVRRSRANYNWLGQLTSHLLDVYYFTSGKFHGCKEIFVDLLLFNPLNNNQGLTSFVICMPDQFKVADDPVSSYRNYYCYKQSMFRRKKMTWKYRGIPSWYVEKSLGENHVG